MVGRCQKSQLKQVPTPGKLKKALEEIRRDTINPVWGTQKYNIPTMTISYHHRGLRGVKSSSMARSTALS